MRTAISPLALLRPQSMRDALRMLREEGPLTPLAGCTDVYVGLNFGTVRDRRFSSTSGGSTNCAASPSGVMCFASAP